MLEISTNSPETLQVFPKATHKAHNPTNVSKVIPKAAKVYKKSSKGGPKAPKRVQTKIPKAINKHPKRHPETRPKRNPEL